MPIPVKLREVLDEMEVPNEEWSVYLNKRTGEFVTVTPDDELLVEDESTLENLPNVRDALDSDDYVVLPDKFEIHEWSIMERFARSRTNPDEYDALDRAIRGSGAFRSFRDAVDRLELRDEWFRFRDNALSEIAVSWLEKNGIPYEREQPG